MKIFKELFCALNKERVKYMIAGGIAVNLYGIERATADIDIIVNLEKSNLLRFADAVKKMGLKPRIPVKLEDFIDDKKREKWISDKGLMVFSLYDPKAPFFLLDVFVAVPFDFSEVYSRRRKMKLEDIIIPVIPIRDLIKMKNNTDRPQDMADVYYLKKILKEWNDEK
jgi:hypothetical protein